MAESENHVFVFPTRRMPGKAFFEIPSSNPNLSRSRIYQWLCAKSGGTHMERIGNLVSSNTLSEQALRLRYRADPTQVDSAQGGRSQSKGSLDVSTSTAGEVGQERRLGARADTAAEGREPARRADDGPRRSEQANGEQKARARYQRDDRTLLKIRTQEGDVVKLRFAVSDAIRVDAKAGADEETLAELQLRASQDRRLSIMVRGELSETEMAAVRSVIEQASAVADDFFANDLSGAFATASSFNVDGSQLARVNLDLRRRESVTYSELGTSPQEARRRDEAGQRYRAAGEAGAERGTPGAAVGPTPRNAGEPVEPPPVSTDVSAQPDPEAVAGTTDPAAPTESLTPGTSLADALSSINRFLQRLLDRFEERGPAQQEAAAGSEETGFTFKLQVFESLVFTASQTQEAREAETESEAAQPAGLPDLLADTLAGLASESRLVLDAKA